MSWRAAALTVGSLAAAGALAGGALYGFGVLPESSPGVAKVVGGSASSPVIKQWARAAAVLDTGTGAVAGETGADHAGLDGRLAELAGAYALGGHVGVAVVELVSGAVVYESDAHDPVTPASTMKILTAAAVLETLGPDHRFTTAVVARSDSAGETEITLVGAGDPTLASTGDAVPTRDSATLDELAEATAAALEESGVRDVRLSFDDSLFSGPTIDPDWRPTYVPSGVAGPVAALSLDGARSTPGMRARVDDPGQFAADRFAAMLAERGIQVAGGDPARVNGAGGEQIAAVSSPPVSSIVEYFLRTSDNDVAETMARHVALGLDRPGSSEEASAAVKDVLADLGVDLSGVTVADGSGLSRNNMVTASTLVAVLSTAADPDRPHLRPVISGLPVSGFNGTLEARTSGQGAGFVRAKTGTLTGVHSLAGVVAGSDGTTYIFAIVADDAADALGARAALDDFAAALAAG